MREYHCRAADFARDYAAKHMPRPRSGHRRRGRSGFSDAVPSSKDAQARNMRGQAALRYHELKHHTCLIMRSAALTQEVNSY